MLKKDFYGDSTRWFVARVVDNLDPLEQSRVKIAIKGIHSEKQTDIPVGGLPWAHTLLPTTEGGTSGIGKHAQLYPNALVFGVFLDGERSQLPLILGSMNQIEQPADTQDFSDNSIIPIINDNNVVVSRNEEELDDEGNPATANSPGTTSGGVILSEDTIKYGDKTNNRNSRRWSSVNFFVENGFTVKQACGITGNLEMESGFRPTVVSSYENEDSQGIAQWNPDYGRLQQLKNFAAYSNRDWRAFTTQLLYIMHEFQGRKIGTNDGAGTFRTCFNVIKNTNNYTGGQPPKGREKFTKNATYAFHRWHSGGGNPPRSWINATLSKREKYADDAYKQYMNSVETS